MLRLIVLAYWRFRWPQSNQQVSTGGGMAARTGEQFLRGLAGRRDLLVGGDKISSIVDHPALSGAARALAEVFDLQYRQADVCLMPDSRLGRPQPNHAANQRLPHSRQP